MAEQDTFERVKALAIKLLGSAPEKVTMEARFREDLEADSLDLVELIMQFEEAFDLDIPDEDAEKISNVKDAIDYIEGKMAKK